MTGNDQIPVPLRTILRNFLNLFESCEAGISDGGSTYEKEFQELKQFSETLKTDPAYLCKEGEKTVNRKKNRYKDILPFDYTRVILGDFGDVPGSDYINANFIKGASGSSAYVASQGPLHHTVNDFWRMVVECEVQVIVMACNEQESGKHKCENYWVEEEGVERQFGQVKIWLKKCRQVCPDFLVRTMRISYTTAKGEIEERNVCQFHYSAWPDHGVPTKVRPLLDMVRLIRDCQTSETLPVLVHCSAGCGRTGTICAIDYVWGLLRLGKLTSDFSLFNLVREMRRQRIAMVQTKDQYIMVHRAVKELFEEQLKIIESHPYANVDQHGLPIDIKGDLEEHTYETVEYNPTLDLAPYQPSTSVPPIPPPHQDLAVNSKLEKEIDNHCSRRKDERPSRWGQQKLDDMITVLSSEGEDVEKECPRNKKAGALRSAILRKPSIVKIKSFFEKSKDGKKSGGTNLSRAKSDVSSSKFYAFNFHSRGGAQSSKSPTPSLDAIVSAEGSTGKTTTTINPNPSKAKLTKPPLFAKPLLPIKRSKSLKLGKEDSFEQMDSKTRVKQQKPDYNQDATTSASLCSSVSNISSYPIKVCIKQVEIPEMKKPVSTSVKPEIQTATTLEINKPSSSTSSSSSWTKKSSDSSSSSAKKPMIPPKSHTVKESSQTSATNRIKMGVAKEMEDVLDFGRSNAKYEQLKKYDTVVIKGPNSNRTSLTRSQSHVWQPTKVQMPFRIFSDENIHQSGETTETNLMSHQAINHNSSNLSQSNGKVQERRKFGSFDESISKQSGGVSITIGSNSSDQRQPPDVELYSTDIKPLVRRRVPKTNPYANYTPGVIDSCTPPHTQSPSTPRSSKVAAGVGPSTSLVTLVDNLRIPKDLPQLKPGYSRSRENSSESSSNTATPRSSLPGTPTQTIDSTYAQIMRSNMQGLGISKNFGRNNGTTPPKSILKGSLSSTPSESDERLDIGRQASCSPSHAKPPQPSIITPPQKINTVRLAMGIRERRNSFRQAVCKDKEEPFPKDEFRAHFPLNARLFSDGSQKSGDVGNTTNTNRVGHLNNCPVRSHKDYEPIWPENGQLNGSHFSNGGFAIVSDDSYINRAPMKPQTISKYPINYGPEPMTSNRQPLSYSNANSQRSHSEERTLQAYPNQPNQNSQPFQSRFDEIKLLLEELKAPNAVTATQHQLLSSSTSKSSEDATTLLKGPTASAVSLKYQRSLRTPSKPNYHTGLSCFTFRKPNSLESLTDSFHYDMKGPSMNGDTVPLVNQNGFGESSSSSGAQCRNSNDYVSLRQGQTSYEATSFPYSNSCIPRLEAHNSHIGSNDVPIAPPRTKKMQKSNTIAPTTVVNANLDEGGTPSWHPASDAANSNIGSKNLPEVVRCSQQQKSQSQIPTSPKHIIKAMGIFHAKAANMKSMLLSNWNDNREKSSGGGSSSIGGEKSNGCTSVERDELDGGFVSSTSSLHSQNNPSNRPTSRHQYL